MVIIYRDVELKEHEIDLKEAVDVRIGNLTITQGTKGIEVRATHEVVVFPKSSNAVTITEK